MNFNLSDLMGSMQNDQPEESTTHPIDPRAQAMELRDRFRRAGILTPLVPGMLCREKRGMAMLRRDQLVIFWRWLDPADVLDATLIDETVQKRHVSRIDCLIGFLALDGDLILTPNESWRLEACDAAFPEDDGEAK